MARITVEDSLENIPNRFHLVLVATKRARQLAAGAAPRLEWENDKPTVMALREIAAGVVDESVLDEVTAEEHAAPAGVAEDEVREEISPPMAEASETSPTPESPESPE